METAYDCSGQSCLACISIDAGLEPSDRWHITHRSPTNHLQSSDPRMSRCDMPKVMTDEERFPKVSDLGAMLRNSVQRETARIPNVPMSQTQGREESRKMYERAAIDFLANLGIDYESLTPDHSSMFRMIVHPTEW